MKKNGFFPTWLQLLETFGLIPDMAEVGVPSSGLVTSNRCALWLVNKILRICFAWEASLWSLIFLLSGVQSALISGVLIPTFHIGSVKPFIEHLGSEGLSLNTFPLSDFNIRTITLLILLFLHYSLLLRVNLSPFVALNFKVLSNDACLLSSVAKGYSPQFQVTQNGCLHTWLQLLASHSVWFGFSKHQKLKTRAESWYYHSMHLYLHFWW